MTKDMTVLLEDKEALDIIRSRFNVKEDRFFRGVDFVSKVLDGDMSKNKAYMLAFDVDIETARFISAP